jgi:hypothetical protein
MLSRTRWMFIDDSIARLPGAIAVLDQPQCLCLDANLRSYRTPDWLPTGIHILPGVQTPAEQPVPGLPLKSRRLVITAPSPEMVSQGVAGRLTPS